MLHHVMHLRPCLHSLPQNISVHIPSILTNSKSLFLNNLFSWGGFINHYVTLVSYPTEIKLPDISTILVTASVYKCCRVY